jgi:hypothetical protein
MSDTNTGGPAFPVNTSCAPDYDGMTLRDYFAAKAMQALIKIYEPKGEDGCIPDVAEAAYFYADAMLKAREA